MPLSIQTHHTAPPLEVSELFWMKASIGQLEVIGAVQAVRIICLSWISWSSAPAWLSGWFDYAPAQHTHSDLWNEWP